MTKYDIAYSLNKQKTIEANSWEEAEQKLKEAVEAEGILLYDGETDENPDGYSLEVFDVNEEEEE